MSTDVWGDNYEEDIDSEASGDAEGISTPENPDEALLTATQARREALYQFEALTSMSKTK